MPHMLRIRRPRAGRVSSLQGSRILSPLTTTNSVEGHSTVHHSTVLRRGPRKKGHEGMCYVPGPFYHHRWLAPNPIHRPAPALCGSPWPRQPLSTPHAAKTGRGVHPHHDQTTLPCLVGVPHPSHHL